MRPCKRALLAGILLSLVGFAAIWVRTWHLRSDEQQLDQESAPLVTEFTDTIGMNVHMAYHWTSYANESAVLRALDFLGVTHVRDKLLPWDSATPRYEALAKAGIKFDFAIPVIEKTADIEGFISQVKAFDQKFPGSITAIEGPNEVNIWPVIFNGGETIADAGNLQRALYTALRQDPTLSHIPVYNLTLAFTDAVQHRQLGELSKFTDFANMHPYVWSWGKPLEGLPYLLDFARISAPTKPMVITETGYTTTTQDPYSGVTEDVQAIFLLQTLLDAFKMKVTRTYIYQLQDEKLDPTGADPQQHFGVFRFDGRPKPAAIAIRNLGRVLRDSDDHRPEPVAASHVTVSSKGAKPSQLLLRKGDGTRCLILWIESPRFEKASRAPLQPERHNVRIKFNGRQDIAVFRVLNSDLAEHSLNGADEIDIALADDPVVVQFRAPISRSQ